VDQPPCGADKRNVRARHRARTTTVEKVRPNTSRRIDAAPKAGRPFRQNAVPAARTPRRKEGVVERFVERRTRHQRGRTRANVRTDDMARPKVDNGPQQS